MKKLYLIKRKKEKNGNVYTFIMLVADLGYGDVAVSFDKDLIASLLDWPVSRLFSIDYDKKVEVGSFVLSDKKDVK